MTAADFRRIALCLEGVEEGSHMGAADFRVGGRIFATLAAAQQGYGNLMLTPDQQAAFVAEQPDLFFPIAGGWGKNGATHILLARANEDLLTGALRTAWKLRIEKNQLARARARNLAKQRSVAKAVDPEILRAAKERKADLRARLTNADALARVKKRYGLDD
jgi:hypothetical protein